MGPLTLAVERPALLPSVCVYEPGIPTYLEAQEDLRAFAEDAQVLFAPVAAAVAAGDLEAALVHLIDGSASRRGHFATQSKTTQQIERDNAHTLPRLLQQTPPPPLTAAQLAAIGVPTCVAVGERTRPAYGIVARAAQAAIPEHALTVRGAGHMWPDEDPDAFCDAVLAFVASCRALRPNPPQGDLSHHSPPRAQCLGVTSSSFAEEVFTAFLLASVPSWPPRGCAEWRRPPRLNLASRPPYTDVRNQEKPPPVQYRPPSRPG